jgi:acetoin utilization deacetylase AcuC-like enzyme
MQVVYSPVHRGHHPETETIMGQPVPANEQPERAERIRATLLADGSFEFIAPTEHGLDPIMAVHDPGLVTFLEEGWLQMRREGIDRPALAPEGFSVRGLFEGFEGLGGSPDSAGRRQTVGREPKAINGRAGHWAFDTSTPIVEGTYRAARAAVDVALSAVDAVLDDGERGVYGLCRPPGHHAARSMYGGYCYFNNAAIAAQSIVARTHEPVAILDVDFHHGNGTEQIFWRRGDVLYVSIHADPDDHYPYFLGRADEVGEGPGRGANLNLPLPSGTGDDAYTETLDRALGAIDRFGGSTLVVSLGLDTYRDDPISDFALTTPVYGQVGRRVASLGRRLVILQEGGYHRPSLGNNVREWLRGVMREPGYDRRT